MFFVYILTSLSGTLYVGLTDDLRRRVEEHKLGLADAKTNSRWEDLSKQLSGSYKVVLM
jgi:predicted GIY-YIG superfamily endonuclease